MRLWLIRHARATCNTVADDDTTSTLDEDAPLTDEGHAQARALAACARPAGLEAVVSSPLRRARQTAAPLAERWGVALRLEPRLSELRAPRFDPPITGRQWDALLAERWRRPDEEIVPGLESVAAQRLRVAAALDDLRHGAAGCVVVVSHAFTIELALACALGLADAARGGPRFKVSPTGIFIVDCAEAGAAGARGPRLVTANSKAHLGIVA